MVKLSVALNKSKKKRSSDSSISVVREDKTYKRSKKRLEIIMQDIDIKALINEIYSLHVTRGVTALSGRKIVQDSMRILINSSVEEIAARSRCTSIKLSVLQALIDIEELHSHLSKYILSKYAGQMRQDGHTTITSQKAQVDVYLRQFIEIKRNLENIMKMADLVLTDVDAAGWSLKRIQEALDSSKKDR